MKQKERSGLGYYTIGIAALFLAGFLLLVILGATSYRNTVDSQNGNQETRSVISYISTAVKSNDAKGSVSVKNGEYGIFLEILSEDSGYARRIYVKDGKLLEDFSKKTNSLNPDSAQIIGDCDRLEINEIEKDLYEVTTDKGTVVFSLRSGGGDE